MCGGPPGSHSRMTLVSSVAAGASARRRRTSVRPRPARASMPLRRKVRREWGKAGSIGGVPRGSGGGRQGGEQAGKRLGEAALKLRVVGMLQDDADEDVVGIAVRVV